MKVNKAAAQSMDSHEHDTLATFGVAGMLMDAGLSAMEAEADRKGDREAEGEVKESLSWAEMEFGSAHLGDPRRTARLVQLATVLAAAPAASLPQASGDTATLKAAYRFFDNKEVIPEAILDSHVASTIGRCQSVPLVLAAQDTTLLDWTSHPATTGLGPLASAKHKGLMVHSTLAITPERLPVGLLAQEVWCRDEETFGDPIPRQERAIEDKESNKWLTSLKHVNAARRQCPNTHFVSVGDRESDVYDLFLAAREPGVDLLVRASWDRRIAAGADAGAGADGSEPKQLRAAVFAAPIASTLNLDLPSRAARLGCAAQAARTATVSVRWCCVELRPPKKRSKEKLRTVPVWAVLVNEEQPPAGVVGLEWLLLTTCRVYETSQALQRVEWYACRWGIEVWHKVLKSGCRIESRQLASADRLKRCMALYSVIAWRVLYGVMLAREAPDIPCTALLEEAEWQALYCRLHQTSEVPEEPMSMREAVRGIARLGGFLGRRGDGEPGVTVLWRGWQQLHELTILYQIMRPQKKAPPPRKRDVGKD